MPHKPKRPVESEWFEVSTLTAAKRLLGKELCTRKRGRVCKGIIVEVEAYLGSRDPAAHSFRGPSKRNEVMFRTPGHCYVYISYGLHMCVNFVTRPVGIGEAILIRALEPTEGLATMRRRRRRSDIHALTNGPGKLCQALGIDLRMNGQHYFSSTSVWLEPGRPIKSKEIGVSRRIGITKNTAKPWRFFIKGNPWLSRQS